MNDMKRMMAALRREILWCERNPGVSGKGVAWEAGFLEGVKQAEKILKAVQSSGGRSEKSQS